MLTSFWHSCTFALQNRRLSSAKKRWVIIGQPCILRLLGPMQDSRDNKYLGLPSIIGKLKTQVFTEIKERVAKSLLVGKVNSFQLVGAKFSSRRSHKQSQPIPWAVFNSLRLFVLIWKIWCAIFGRGRKIKSTKLLGLVGGKCASRNFTVGWVSGTYKPLI